MARGRPRKQGKREPNGRVVRKTRFETEEEIMEAVISMRVRAGIPRHLARSVGTMEAALFAADLISRDQYEAALYYLEARMKYLSAIDEPHSPKEPRGPSRGGGEEAHEKFCEASREKWEGLRATILDFQRQYLDMTANLMDALDCLERGHLQESQVGDLRYALNAVHRYRISQKKSAA